MKEKEWKLSKKQLATFCKTFKKQPSLVIGNKSKSVIEIISKRDGTNYGVVTDSRLWKFVKVCGERVHESRYIDSLNNWSEICAWMNYLLSKSKQIEWVPDDRDEIYDSDDSDEIYDSDDSDNDISDLKANAMIAAFEKLSQ